MVAATAADTCQRATSTSVRGAIVEGGRPASSSRRPPAPRIAVPKARSAMAARDSSTTLSPSPRASAVVKPLRSTRSAEHLAAVPTLSVPRNQAPPDPEFIRDSYGSTALAEIIDRSIHGATARFTGGLSPMALSGAYLDWPAHLAFSPGKQARLAEKAVKKYLRLVNYASRRVFSTDGGQPCIEPLPQDRRFLGKAWQNDPWNLIWQGFLLQQQWLFNATTGVHGVTPKHEKMVSS